MQILKNHKTSIVLAGILTALILFLAFTASANPAFNGQSAQTAVATTSPVYQTAGRATTTVMYDASEVNGTNQTNNGNTFIPDEAVLLLQYAASSTASAIDIDIQYCAYECSSTTGDWYSSNLYDQSTTTPTQSVTTAQNFRYQFSSTTIDKSAVTNANSATSTKAIAVKTPVRWVRAVITTPVGFSAGAVWAQFVPKKQLR